MPPNGDVLVAETNAPPKSGADEGIGGWVAKMMMARAGAGAGVPSANRIGAFIGQHGSWNRRPFSGYKVIFVPFSAGSPPVRQWTC